ncbi:hypothetical protein [Ensifer sp. SSB1]|uniref:hypothetical protein n=1 Tax=Ensifer sp. SSB1 TaxID=2795385 RepID=UPI0025BAA9A5|nr:hypothetical protein [Ensifer sp. SSB1]
MKDGNDAPRSGPAPRHAVLTRRVSAGAHHRLYSRRFGAILFVMKRWSVRQLGLFFLAVFVAAGMSLSVAQASSMAAKMATMAEMTMSDHGDCQDCPDQAGAMKAMACGKLCAAPVVAPLPTAIHIPAGDRLAPVAAREPFLFGWVWPPDPAPPRTFDIG